MRLPQAALAAAAILAAQPARADFLFVLDNVVFSDGATATGQFSVNIYGFLDAPTSITTTAVLAIPGGIYAIGTNYLNSTPQFLAFTLPGFSFTQPGYTSELFIALTNPVVAGVSNPIDTGNSYECVGPYACTITRTIVSGSVQVTSTDAQPYTGPGSTPIDTPEPASLALLTAGLASLAFARRRRG